MSNSLRPALNNGVSRDASAASHDAGRAARDGSRDACRATRDAGDTRPEPPAALAKPPEALGDSPVTPFARRGHPRVWPATRVHRPACGVAWRGVVWRGAAPAAACHRLAHAGWHRTWPAVPSSTLAAALLRPCRPAELPRALPCHPVTPRQTPPLPPAAEAHPTRAASATVSAPPHVCQRPQGRAVRVPSQARVTSPPARPAPPAAGRCGAPPTSQCSARRASSCRAGAP